MKRNANLTKQITLAVFDAAAERAATDHKNEKEVVAFMTDKERNCEWLYYEFQKGTYTRLLEYRQLEKVNSNGKHRHIDSPTFITRIYQYVFLIIYEPIYYTRDPNVGLNCKPGHGITAADRRNSVIKRLKHLYYDRRNFEYVVVLDQRQCYAHITIKVFRRMLRRTVNDPAFVDYAVNVCFVNGHLPIGTPTSPMAHHIIMLPFDLWLKSEAPEAVRYADDNIIPVETKEEAQAIKWRIKNCWWYVLGIRAKKGMTKVLPMRLPNDFCGYITHRNAGKGITDHNKGFVTLRRSTFEKACKSTDRNWGSYFGIMKPADLFREMQRIEKDMDLRKLTEKIRIDRTMDAENIKPKELVDNGIVFTVYDYEIRKDRDGADNWIKCLIGFPEKDEAGNDTGRILAREFHGGYQYLVAFHLKLEEHFDKAEILPLEHCELENKNGFIYKGSTNQIKFIEL